MNTQTRQIQKAIAATGGTQEALAATLGVSQTTISKWLHGKAQPSIGHALKLERITDGLVRAQDLRPEVREYLAGMRLAG